MKFSFKLVILTALTSGVVVPGSALATNGAWMIGYGAESRSMGGTGVADNRGGMAAAFNPATMIESGTRFDLGADLFIPPRVIKHESARLGYTDEESNHNIFSISSKHLGKYLGIILNPVPWS